MNLTWALSVIVFATVMSGTPGPNNTMLTASGANYGFRRTVPHILGICMGVMFILAVAGSLGGAVVSDPTFHAVLKWVGVIYLTYLAWRIATAVPAPRKAREADDTAVAAGRPLSFLQATLFQFVNPKFWVTSASAIVTYVGSMGEGDATLAAFSLALLFGIVTLPCCSFWVMIGVGASRLLQTARAMRIFNIIMALLLIASLVPIVLE